MLQEWPGCLLVVRLWEWVLKNWTQSMVSACCIYGCMSLTIFLTLMCRTLYINTNCSFHTFQHSPLAHSNLGIGGLQFGGQPLSTGTNGAGQYGRPMLSYYCIPLLTECIFHYVTEALKNQYKHVQSVQWVRTCSDCVQVMVEAPMGLLVMANQLENMVSNFSWVETRWSILSTSVKQN